MGDFFTYDKNNKLYFERQGNGPVPIVFLHGFACSILNWKFLRQYFNTQLYSLYLIDLKGFGLSDKPHDGKYSLKDHADTISQFITAKHLKNVIIVGHSYGGGVALLTYLNSADSVIQKLILLGTPGYADYIPRFIRILRKPFLNRLALFVLFLYPIAIKRGLRKVYHNPDKVTREIINLYRPYYKRLCMQYTYIHTALQAIPDDYDKIIGLYKNISIPVLLLWGIDDKVVPNFIGKKMSENIPGSVYKVIEQCGHNTIEECPEETYSAISSFIEA